MATEDKIQIVVLEPCGNKVGELLKILEEKNNVEGVRVWSVEEALLASARFAPCIVLCSILDTAGITLVANFLKKAANMPKHGALKTIVVSNIKMPQLADMITNLGVADYIMEPVPAKTIYFKVALQLKAVEMIKKQKVDSGTGWNYQGEKPHFNEPTTSWGFAPDSQDAKENLKKIDQKMKESRQGDARMEEHSGKTKKSVQELLQKLKEKNRRAKVSALPIGQCSGVGLEALSGQVEHRPTETERGPRPLSPREEQCDRGRAISEKNTRPERQSLEEETEDTRRLRRRREIGEEKNDIARKIREEMEDSLPDSLSLDEEAAIKRELGIRESASIRAKELGRRRRLKKLKKLKERLSALNEEMAILDAEEAKVYNIHDLSVEDTENTWSEKRLEKYFQKRAKIRAFDSSLPDEKAKDEFSAETSAGLKEQDPYSYRKESEITPLGAAWERAGEYYVFISWEIHYRGFENLEPVLPLWYFSGEKAPELLGTEKVWRFWKNEPVCARKVDQLPKVVEEYLQGLKQDAMRRKERLAAPMKASQKVEPAKPENPFLTIFVAFSDALGRGGHSGWKSIAPKLLEVISKSLGKCEPMVLSPGPENEEYSVLSHPESEHSPRVRLQENGVLSAITDKTGKSPLVLGKLYIAPSAGRSNFDDRERAAIEKIAGLFAALIIKDEEGNMAA